MLGCMCELCVFHRTIRHWDRLGLSFTFIKDWELGGVRGGGARLGVGGRGEMGLGRLVTIYRGFLERIGIGDRGVRELSKG